MKACREFGKNTVLVLCSAPCPVENSSPSWKPKQANKYSCKTAISQTLSYQYVIASTFKGVQSWKMHTNIWSMCIFARHATDNYELCGCGDETDRLGRAIHRFCTSVYLCWYLRIAFTSAHSNSSLNSPYVRLIMKRWPYPIVCDLHWLHLYPYSF